MPIFTRKDVEKLITLPEEEAEQLVAITIEKAIMESTEQMFSEAKAELDSMVEGMSLFEKQDMINDYILKTACGSIAFSRIMFESSNDLKDAAEAQ